MPQDFSGKTLQGHSFKGQDLTGVNFSCADIRGADFTNAILINTNFSHVRSGMRDGWAMGLVIGAVILEIIAGLLASIFAGTFAGIGLRSGEIPSLFTAVVLLILLAVFARISIQRGLETALLAVAATAVGTVTLTVAVALMGGLAGSVPITGTLSVATALVGAVAGAFAGIAIVAETVSLAIAITVAGSANIWGGVTAAVAGLVAMAGGASGAVMMSMALAAVGEAGVTGVSPEAGMMAGAEALANMGSQGLVVRLWNLAGAGVGFAVVAGVIVLVLPAFILSSYISWQTLTGDEKYAFIRRIAVSLAAAAGTNFRGANLTDADFTQSTVKSSDFRWANLTRTRWFQTKNLDESRIDGTYLENWQIRQLAVTGEGKNKIFDNQNLQGVNLRRAKLANASFLGANLCQTNLQEADLTGAILVRSQLELTDLTGACLTGACIENWGITKTTKLNKINCKYVYLRYVSEEKRDRLPSKGEFQEGEFRKFVKSILDSFDLYHDREVNAKAAVSALQSLSKEYQEPIEIVGLENRQSQIIFKLKTSNPDKSEQIQQDYQARYSKTLNLSLLDAASELSPYYQTIERRIIELIEEVKQPRSTSIKYLYNEGMVITGGNVRADIHQSIVQTSQATRTSATEQQPVPLNLKQSEFKELLTRLQVSIEAAPELTPEEKAEILDDVKLLAEVGNNSPTSAMQKQAKMAIRVLRGTISELPETASLAREGEELLQAIAQILNL